MDITTTLDRLLPVPDGDPPIFHRTGVVAALNSDGTADVTLGGTTIGDVPILDGAVLAVSDTVQVLSWEGDMLVLGRALSSAAVAPAAPPPIGSIIMWGAASAPTGWQLCQGQAISRTTFAELFAVIGTTYGAGNGSTTFNVPDMQQRFPLGHNTAGGVGGTLGGSGGTISHTHTQPNHSHNASGLTTSSAGAHTHTIPSAGGHDHGGATGTGTPGTSFADGIVSSRANLHTHTISTAGAHTHGGADSGGSHDHNVTGSTGSAGNDDTGSANPPYLVFKFIIRVS